MSAEDQEGRSIVHLSELIHSHPSRHLLPCSSYSPMSFSQELVAPIAPPRGLGFGHPALGAAFSHQAMGWGFVVRNELKQAAKVKDSPWSTLLVPKEPNSHHCSKEDHFPQQQPLTSCTLAIHLQFSSASSPVSCRCPRSLWGGLAPGRVGAWNKKPPCCSICAIQWKTAFIGDTLIARLECKKL